MKLAADGLPEVENWAIEGYPIEHTPISTGLSSAQLHVMALHTPGEGCLIAATSKGAALFKLRQLALEALES